MDRLTRPEVDTDQTAVRFMDNEVKIQGIGDKLLNLILNGPTINGVNKNTLRHILRQLYAALKPYEELDMTPEDIEQTLLNFSSFLMEMTGGRMSKTNYTVQAMVDEAYASLERDLEEAKQEAYDLGVDSVLRNHFDIPWDEAADLRKNIDHLQELLKAEEDGRLTITPCAIGDTVYGHDGKKVTEYKVVQISYIKGTWYLLCKNENSDFWAKDAFNGEIIFRTYQEAEAALAKDTEKEE